MAQDRGQSAAVFTLLGAMVGAILVAGALWLQSLGKNLNDQSKQLEALAKAQDKTVAAAKEGLAAERISAKESALDSLLSDLKVDPAAPKLATKLSQLIAQRDEAKKELSRIKVEKDALADHASELDDRLKANEIASENTIRKLQELDKQNTLDYDKLKTQNETLVDEMKSAKKLVSDNTSGTLQAKYNWTFYAAIAGWIGFIGCGLGLMAVASRRDEQDIDRRDEDRPMHTVSIK